MSMPSLSSWARRAGPAAGLVIATGVLACVAVRVVISAFTQFDHSRDQLIVRQLRLPRTGAGVMAGSALAIHVRNT